MVIEYDNLYMTIYIVKPYSLNHLQAKLFDDLVSFEIISFPVVFWGIQWNNISDIVICYCKLISKVKN